MTNHIFVADISSRTLEYFYGFPYFIAPVFSTPALPFKHCLALHCTFCWPQNLQVTYNVGNLDI